MCKWYFTGNGCTWACWIISTSIESKIPSDEMELIWKVLSSSKFTHILHIPCLCNYICSTVNGPKWNSSKYFINIISSGNSINQSIYLFKLADLRPLGLIFHTTSAIQNIWVWNIYSINEIQNVKNLLLVAIIIHTLLV